MSAINIRELVDSDWEDVARLMNSYETYGMTGEILRTRNALWDGNDPRLRLVAEHGGTLIGYCRSIRTASEPKGIFRISVYVDKEFSGQGLGRELLARVEQFATDRGGTAFLTTVEESCPRAIKFAGTAGYEKSQRLFESKLDVRSLDSSAYDVERELLKQQGFRFTTFEALGENDDNWRSLYDTDNETDGDTPGAENWSLGTWENYRDRVRTSFGYTPAGINIALQGERWAGVNIVKDSPNEGEWNTDYTGVRREFRGRGLAQALKVLGIEFAGSRGARVMVTNNDERNAPMLAVNKKLGFVAQPGFFVVKKTLPNSTK